MYFTFCKDYKAGFLQDFLNTQVETIGPLHTDLWLGERWMRQMGEAANRYGLWMQYCMALPRHLMTSLMIPVVSHVSKKIT